MTVTGSGRPASSPHGPHRDGQQVAAVGVVADVPAGLQVGGPAVAVPADGGVALEVRLTLTANCGPVGPVLDNPAFGLQLGAEGVGPGPVLGGPGLVAGLGLGQGLRRQRRRPRRCSGRPRASSKMVNTAAARAAARSPVAARASSQQIEGAGHRVGRVEVVVHALPEAVEGGRIGGGAPGAGELPGEGVEPLDAGGGRGQGGLARRSSASGSAIAGPGAGRPGGRRRRAARAGRGCCRATCSSFPRLRPRPCPSAPSAGRSGGRRRRPGPARSRGGGRPGPGRRRAGRTRRPAGPAT